LKKLLREVEGEKRESRSFVEDRKKPGRKKKKEEQTHDKQGFRPTSNERGERCTQSV